MWFAESNKNKVGRITMAGRVTLYRVPTFMGGPYGITTGPDGRVWFTEIYGNKIGALTPPTR